MVQWLRLCTSNERDMGSIPGGLGIKIPHATGWGGAQKINKNKTILSEQLIASILLPCERVRVATALLLVRYHGLLPLGQV